MTKKVFALAGVTAVAGLMVSMVAAGCSSTTTVTDPGTDGSTEATVKDGAAKDTSPIDEDSSTSTTCPGTDPVTEADFGITFAPSGAPQTVCTQGDLDAIKKVFADGGGSASYTNLQKALSTTCAPCVFSDVMATRWGMVVTQNGSAILDNSIAACFGVVATSACAKARFDVDTCLEIVCPTDCGAAGSSQASACQQKALTGSGPCSAFTSPYTTACPDESGYLATCDNFVKIIEITCGGGPDAGLDASN